MEFIFNPSSSVIYEGWLTKAYMGIFERWQKRYFRLQGRCLYYWKKESGNEPPNGNIPLVDINVQDIPKKGHQYTFSITLTKNPEIAKRAEYIIEADTEDQKRKWKDAILNNRCYSIVSEPFQLSTETNPQGNNAHLTLPYFFPPIIQVLNQTGYKLRNIWTVEVPNEIINKGLATINFNYMLPTDDIHNSVAIVLAYLKSLPEGLLPGESMLRFASKVAVDDLKQLIRVAPAPVRQLLLELGFHFKKVLENSASNGVTQYSLLPFLGPILIRPPAGSSMVPSQIKSIQDSIAQCFLQNITKVLEDVHQFLDAPRLPVIRRARVIQGISQKTEEQLEASRGLLVYVVREDSYGWCTAYTSNRRVGLIHSSNLKPLSAEEEKELNSGPNIDALTDIVREHCPEMMLIFDGMIDEIMKLKDAYESRQ